MRSLRTASSGVIAFAGITLAIQAAAPGVAIYTENMGSPASTTSIASNAFQNGSLVFTGTGDVRSTQPSAGYSGASAGGNVFLTNNGTASFQIASLNTSAQAAAYLAFGAYKSTIASDMTELKLEYSTDGALYNTIPIPAQTTGSGTANWRLLAFAAPVLPSSSSLMIRWTNTSTTAQFRIDDFGLYDSLSDLPVPEPTAMGPALLAGAAMLRRRR